MKNPERIAAYLSAPDIHDAAHAGRAEMLSLAAALLLTLGHALNTWLFFFSQSIGFPAAIAIHVLLALAAFLLARTAKTAADSRFLWLLCLSSAALGVFGTGGMTVTILLHHWYMRYAQPFSHWFASIFPIVEANEPQRIYDDIVVGRDEASKNYSVIPFVDVLWYGNEEQKRTALAKMTSRFHPSFAPAFKKALNDSSNTIRVQAATAISKIENQFVAQMMKLNQLLARYPQEPDVILSLAEHYDDYAFTGILDADREGINREQALKYYTLYLEKRPNDTLTRLRVGRLLLRSGESKRAADWLAACLEEGHRNPALLSWYAEALFLSADYSELRKLADHPEMAQIVRLQPKLSGALELWMPAAIRRKGAAA